MWPRKGSILNVQLSSHFLQIMQFLHYWNCWMRLTMNCSHIMRLTWWHTCLGELMDWRESSQLSSSRPAIIWPGTVSNRLNCFLLCSLNIVGATASVFAHSWSHQSQSGVHAQWACSPVSKQVRYVAAQYITLALAVPHCRWWALEFSLLLKSIRF